MLGFGYLTALLVIWFGLKFEAANYLRDKIVLNQNAAFSNFLANEKMLAIREQELAEINKLSNNMETALLEQGAVSSCLFAVFIF